jgi:hypothetical protein
MWMVCSTNWPISWSPSVAMPPAEEQETVALVWHGKTVAGWRRTPVTIGKNGRVKPIEDQAGHYELRFYIGSRLKYENVGTNGSDAIAACARKTKLLAVKDSAQAVGVKIIEEKGRTRLTEALTRFVAAAHARGSNEAAEVYRTSSDEFLEVIGSDFADEVRHEDFTKYHIARLRQGEIVEFPNRYELSQVRGKFGGCFMD